MIQSASLFESYMGDGLSPYHYFIKQFLSIIIGLVAYLIVVLIPLDFYSKFYKTIMVIGLGMLVFLMFNGYISNHAKSWLDLGFFSLQPSELVKIIIIIYMACYYNEKAKKLKEISVFLTPIAISGLSFILVVLQPDLGTGIIIVGITLSIAFLVPNNLWIKKMLGLVLGSVVILLFLTGLTNGFGFLSDMQQSRLDYFEPCARYQEVSGYQVCNGFIAINNGGLFGEGIGNSTQKYLYLPFGYTDFIFAIIVEELGFILGMAIILAILALVYLIYKIGKMSKNTRDSLICYGVGAYILLHLIINLGGVTGMLPITGVPLPFMSYGGSYVLSLIISLGLVQRVYVETVLNKKVKKLKKNKEQ